MPLLEKGKISAQQLMLMTAGFTMGSSTFFPPGSGIGPDSWLACTLGLVEGIIIALIYLTLANRFPDKTLVEINDFVWGPYFGKFFSIIFLFYLFHLGSLAITNMTDFIKFVILPITPPIVFILFGILVCVIAASSGLEVMARSISILVILSSSVFIINDALLLPQIKLANLQPVLETPTIKLLAAGNRAATFPFGETVTFLMIIPFLNSPRKARISVISGIALTGSLFILAIIRNTGVLGATVDYFLYPSYSASRLINIGEVFTKIELFSGITFITTVFIKITVLMYALILGTAQLCKLKSYRTLIIPVWILISLLGIHNFANVIENLEFVKKIYPIYSLPFQVGIPLLAWMTALIRRLPQENP
jgi:spore germination protein KB